MRNCVFVQRQESRDCSKCCCEGVRTCEVIGGLRCASTTSTDVDLSSVTDLDNMSDEKLLLEEVNTQQTPLHRPTKASQTLVRPITQRSCVDRPPSRTVRRPLADVQCGEKDVKGLKDMKESPCRNALPQSLDSHPDWFGKNEITRSWVAPVPNRTVCHIARGWDDNPRPIPRSSQVVASSPPSIRCCFSLDSSLSSKKQNNSTAAPKHQSSTKERGGSGKSRKICKSLLEPR